MQRFKDDLKMYCVMMAAAAVAWSAAFGFGLAVNAAIVNNYVSHTPVDPDGSQDRSETVPGRTSGRPKREKAERFNANRVGDSGPAYWRDSR